MPLQRIPNSSARLEDRPDRTVLPEQLSVCGRSAASQTGDEHHREHGDTKPLHGGEDVRLPGHGWRNGIRKSTRVAELLAEEFFEFGSAGRVFSKGQVIESLRAASPVLVTSTKLQSRLTFTKSRASHLSGKSCHSSPGHYFALLVIYGRRHHSPFADV